MNVQSGEAASQRHARLQMSAMDRESKMMCFLSFGLLVYLSPRTASMTPLFLIWGNCTLYLVCQFQSGESIKEALRVCECAAVEGGDLTKDNACGLIGQEVAGKVLFQP